MASIWNEVAKLAGRTVELRDLHDAVDEIGARVIPVGRVTERDGYRFQTVRVVRHGFRPVTVTARVKAVHS